ncbi:MAG: hypothetical protein NTW21_31165 [Verrucomicrobia bacterium]|nr:hypothetical protein [Verrucomicrobiota bacterium]
MKLGDLIAIALPEAVPLEAAPQAIPLDILYEDADLLVLNKAPSMVVHPAPAIPTAPSSMPSCITVAANSPASAASSGPA